MSHFDAEPDDELMMAELLRYNLQLIPAPDYTNIPMPEPQNVVCNATLLRNVDIFTILKIFPGTDYRLYRFPAVSVRMRPPAGLVARIFQNGNITALGTFVPEETELGLQYLRLALAQRGFDDYAMSPLHTSNRVSSYKLPWCVKIQQAADHADEAGFMLLLEIFPGLIYRNIDPKVTLLIFETGSVMVLGARVPNSAKMAITKVTEILKPFAILPGSPEEEELKQAAQKKTAKKRGRSDSRLTEAERKLLEQARIDDPTAFENELADADMKRLIAEVKARRKALKKQISQHNSGSKGEFVNHLNAFYQGLIKRDREKRTGAAPTKKAAAVPSRPKKSKPEPIEHMPEI